MDRPNDILMHSISLNNSFFSSSFRIPTDISAKDAAYAWDTVWNETTQFKLVDIKNLSSILRNKDWSLEHCDTAASVDADPSVKELIDLRKIARKNESPSTDSRFSQESKKHIRILACSDIAGSFEDTWKGTF